MVANIVVVTASAIAALTDIRRFRVYNALTFPVAFGGLAYHAAWGDGFLFALLGLATGLGILLIPYSLGAIGAGDVKYVAAMGAWLGAPAVLPILLIGCVAMGCYAAVVLARQSGVRSLGSHFSASLVNIQLFFRGGLSKEAANATVSQMAHEPNAHHRLIPFSAMSAIGVLCCVAWQLGVGQALNP